MENILPIHLQEVIFSSSDPKTSQQLSKLQKAGKIRKIAARIYTPNFTEVPEAIIRRNLFTILGRLYPEAVLSHRSALEFKPTSSGHLFLTYTYTKAIKLPGVTLSFNKGPGPVDGDNPVSGQLYASQLERALLENLQVSRKPGPESKTLTLPQIEERLEEVIRMRGDEGLNAVRDKARTLSTQLGMEKEFEKLNKLISALLTTHPAKALSSPVALARAFGNPYDAARLHLFEALIAQLRNTVFADIPEKNTTTSSFRNFAFFEAYFSNYIEGTIFEIDEAKEIIRTQQPMATRNDDSHDILGTYKLVSSRDEMQVTPDSGKKLLEILLYRHQVLLSARTSKNPGSFKNKNNRAGNTIFVDHHLVRGTLMKGFEYLGALEHPFARAAYMMYLVSEVHPFLDGNGRIARVMMNAELVKAGHMRIIIPNVYRDDYLGALRRLTRQGDPNVFIRMLQRAQTFSATVVGDNMGQMQQILEQSNAFAEPDDARLNIIKA